MAEARRNWIKWFVGAALCWASAWWFAHSRTRSILLRSFRSKSNRLHRARLPAGSPICIRLRWRAFSVVLRNQATGAEVHAITAKNGAFRFASLDAGEYTLEADAPQLGHGRLEGILVTGGAEARVQAAMRFEAPSPALVEAATPNPIAAPPLASDLPVTTPAPTVPIRWPMTCRHAHRCRLGACCPTAAVAPSSPPVAPIRRSTPSARLSPHPSLWSRCGHAVHTLRVPDTVRSQRSPLFGETAIFRDSAGNQRSLAAKSSSLNVAARDPRSRPTAERQNRI